jgi:hypothetical protein
MGYDWANPAPATGIEAQSAAGGVALLNLLATPTATDVKMESGEGGRTAARVGLAATTFLPRRLDGKALPKLHAKGRRYEGLSFGGPVLILRPQAFGP